jgi:hypothetical protein
MTVGAAVAHDTNASDVRQQHHRHLPDVVVQSGGGQLCTCDGVSFAEQVQPLLGDLPDNTDAKPRTGERLASHDLLRQPKLGPYSADLILEQGAERLHKLKLQVFRKAAHVVVALDVGCAFAAAGFDDVRVQSALDEELDLLPVGSSFGNDRQLSFFECADEFAADDLAFGLGIADAGKRSLEALLLVRDK